ncbi:MAG: thioredoxin [Bacteroidales bacterium]
MKANFDRIVNVDKPVIVDFHAVWCSPCRVQSPILKDLADELGEKVRIIKIDVDENPEIAGRYSIQAVPTLMVFKNGKVVHKHSGVHSKQQLLQIVNNS